MKKEELVGQYFSTKEIDSSTQFNQRPILAIKREDETVTNLYTKGLECKLSEIEGWAQINWVYEGEDSDMNDTFVIATESEQKQIMPLLEEKRFGNLFMYIPKVEVTPVTQLVVPDEAEPKIKRFNLVDEHLKGKIKHHRIKHVDSFTLQEIFDVTDWADIETDQISDMKVGEVLKFNDEKLIVTRIQ